MPRPAYGPYPDDVGDIARKRYAKLVVHRIGLFPGDRVLDVGTGRGLLAVEVGRSFTRCRVVGLDPDRGLLRTARENAAAANCGGRVSFVQGRAEALPFKDGAFSVFMSGLALAALGKARGKALDECARVLVETGKLMVVDVVDAAGEPGQRDTREWKRRGFTRLQPHKIVVLGDRRVVWMLSARRGEGP